MKFSRRILPAAERKEKQGGRLLPAVYNHLMDGTQQR